jgi:hypothetical protein
LRRYKLGITRFADLTPEEFGNHHTGYGAPKVHEAAGAGAGLEAPREMAGGEGGAAGAEVSGTAMPRELSSKRALALPKLGAGGRAWQMLLEHSTS